jgi:hypothetical protein
MSSIKYQHPTCNRTSRIAAGLDSAQAAHIQAHLGNSLDPRASHLQQSIGNQGVLRLLRQPDSPSGVAIHGAPKAADTGAAGQQPTQQPVQQLPGSNAVQATGQPMPYTALFLIAQHSSAAHQACGLPDTPNCVVSAANWRLIDKAGAPVTGKVTLSEQFTKESGPDDVFQKLDAQKNTAVTSQNGAFSDCYGLCVPDGTPSFSLRVLQNYLVDGQIAAKNHITYSPTGVMLSVCQREADGTFGDRCRRF